MSSNEIIERLVVDASSDPLNPEKNLAIAKEYEKLGQTASAVSFYLRAAEYGYETHPLITYGSLLRISICIEGQKDRNLTVSNVILQAMAYLPDRPEAYFLYSRFNERFKNWQESYTFAHLGGVVAQPGEELPVSVEYPGWYGLDFQKAISAWWIGRKDESKELFTNLINNCEMSEDYLNMCLQNLSWVSR